MMFTIIMIIIIMITMIIGIIVVSKTKVMFTISPRSWSMIIAMMMENPGDEVSGDKKITCIVQKKTQSSLVKQLVPRNSSCRKFSLEIFSQGAISGQDSGKQLNDKWGQIYTFDILIETSVNYIKSQRNIQNEENAGEMVSFFFTNIYAFEMLMWFSNILKKKNSEILEKYFQKK